MTVAAHGRVAAVVTSTAIEVPIEDAEAVRYVGLVTRVLGFAIDALLLNALAVAVAGAVALFYSIISVPEELRTAAIAIGGVLYLLWVVGYFVTFWSTTGQTPGDRILHIRVVPVTGNKVLPRRALLRFVGLTLAALPLFAGYLMILVDDRRRGLHDRIARTLVVDGQVRTTAVPATAPLPGRRAGGTLGP